MRQGTHHLFVSEKSPSNLIHLVAESLYPLPASPYFLTPQRSRRFKSQTSVGENHHTVGSAGVLGPWPPVSGCAFSHLPGCPPSLCPEFLLLRAECLLSILGAYGVRRKLRFPLLLGPPKRKRGGPPHRPGPRALSQSPGTA